MQHVLNASPDCIEEPERRGALLERAARFIDMLMAGALALQGQPAVSPALV